MKPLYQNTNIDQINGFSYRGFNVITNHGPLIRDYLDRIINLTDYALQVHPRLLAIRFDLHFPEHINAHPTVISNDEIVRFISSLKAKLEHNRKQAHMSNANAHDTELFYFWVREVGSNDRVHYHVTIMLNRDAFFTVGRLESNDMNIAKRIESAWASALGLTPEQVFGLAYFPSDHFYRFDRSKLDVINKYIYRVSYLCKAATKYFGDGIHRFGASRIPKDEDL